jgi:hypothetical protein
MAAILRFLMISALLWVSAATDAKGLKFLTDKAKEEGVVFPFFFLRKAFFCKQRREPRGAR